MRWDCVSKKDHSITFLVDRLLLTISWTMQTLPDFRYTTGEPRGSGVPTKKLSLCSSILFCYINSESAKPSCYCEGCLWGLLLSFPAYPLGPWCTREKKKSPSSLPITLLSSTILQGQRGSSPLPFPLIPRGSMNWPTLCLYSGGRLPSLSLKGILASFPKAAIVHKTERERERATELSIRQHTHTGTLEILYTLKKNDVQ